MKQQLQALLAEHSNPRHCDRGKARAGMQPIADYTSSVQQQLAKYKQLLTDLELAAISADADPKLEHMRQTLRALEARVAAFDEAGRDVLKALAQWDRYMLEAGKDMTKIIGDVEAQA